MAISDEDAIMIVIDRNTVWILELAWLVAILAELGHERAVITREHLHSMIIRINDEQEISMMVERHANWTVEQAISSSAILLGAYRELDSSINKRLIADLLIHRCTKSRQSTNQSINQRVEGTRWHPLHLSSYDTATARRRMNKEQWATRHLRSRLCCRRVSRFIAFSSLPRTHLPRSLPITFVCPLCVRVCGPLTHLY